MPLKPGGSDCVAAAAATRPRPRPGPSRLCRSRALRVRRRRRRRASCRSSCLKNAAICRADQTSPKPEIRSRLRCEAARTSDSAFRMLWMSVELLARTRASTGFAPAAPSSSIAERSCRSRSALSAASTGSRRAALSTRPSRSSVTPFIADTTTPRLSGMPPMMPATRRTQVASATLVPPNLWTVQAMIRLSRAQRCGNEVSSGFRRSRA